MTGRFYCIRWLGDRYQCGYTTNGIDFFPIGSATYEKAREAVAYCDLMNQHISPLRGPEEEPTDLPQSTGSSSGPLTRPDVDTPAASS